METNNPYLQKNHYIVDLITSVCVLSITTLIGELLYFSGLKYEQLIMVYTLAILVIARYTDGYFFGVTSAVVGSLIYDFLVTEPRLGFSFTIEFPITLIVMVAVSVISCTMTTQMKEFYTTRQTFFVEAERERTRGVLLRAISHDLRTPLTGILGASSIIEEQVEALSHSEILSLASDIRHNSEWLIRMVENLLAVTRISEGRVKVKMTMEIAEEVMAQAVSVVRKRFPERQIIVKAPEEPLAAPMDPILMSQVFQNLLENAMKYSRDGTPVFFSLVLENGALHFEVRDQGMGIPDYIVEKVFGSSLSYEKEREDSNQISGIGLSICKAIVDAHEGNISGSSLDEGGTAFHVVLPMELETRNGN